MNSKLHNFKHFVARLRFEALALAVLMVALTHASKYSLWVLPATFLIFDIGALGYIFSSKTGALTYNFTHDLTIPTILIAVGVLVGNDLVSVIGFSWTFHIAVDRTLGYGLKYEHSFKSTHLGSIGKSKD